MSAPVLAFTNPTRTPGRASPPASPAGTDGQSPSLVSKAARLAAIRPDIAAVLERMVDRYLAENDDLDGEGA